MEFLVFYFFAALVVPANSLICSCTTDTCKNHTCYVEKGACVSTIEKYNTGSGVIQSVREDCHDDQAHQDGCKDKSLFITGGKDIYWYSKTACCSENCTKSNLEEPKNDTAASRRVCPSCFALHPKPCDAVEIKCAQSQTLCLTVNGTKKEGHTDVPFLGKGCATSTARELHENFTWSIGGATYTIHTLKIEMAKDGASQISLGFAFAVFLTIFLHSLLH